MEEGEYLRRLSGCLINHYRGCMEIHIFTDVGQIKAANITEYTGFLIGDFDLDMPELLSIPRKKILYLQDALEEQVEDGAKELQEEGLIYRMSKYEEVPKIVDMLGMLAGNKELAINSHGGASGTNIYGVYSLSLPQLQLPFLMALADLLAEKKRVLVIDLQENSGLAAEEASPSGLEDVMAMVKSQKYTRGRMISAIGHCKQWDYIYPARNSECLSEGDYELYRSLIQIMEREMHYDVIILNFGMRFLGFFQLMWECKECFLLEEQDKNGWREGAFYEEIAKRKGKDGKNPLIRMEVPSVVEQDATPQSLARQWLWNEPGELLRNILCKEKYRG
jgi:hypothetical protein